MLETRRRKSQFRSFPFGNGNYYFWFRRRRRCRLFWRRADKLSHLIGGAAAFVNAEGNAGKDRIRKRRKFCRTLRFDVGFKFRCVDDAGKVAVDNGKFVEAAILIRRDTNESLGRIAELGSKFESVFKLRRGKCKNDTLGWIVTGVHHEAKVRLCGSYSAMFHEENVAAFKIHRRHLYSHAAKGCLLLKNLPVQGKKTVVDFTVFTIFEGAWIEEMRILHPNSRRTAIDAVSGGNPFREKMCKINKIVTQGHLRKGGIKCFLLGFAYLGEIAVMDRFDEHRSAAISGATGRFRNYDVLGDRRIAADIFNQTLCPGGDRTVFHGVIGIPEYRRSVLAQMIPVSKINKLECDKLVYSTSRQRTRNVVQHLNDPFVLIIHNVRGLYQKCFTLCHTKRKRNQSRNRKESKDEY